MDYREELERRGITGYMLGDDDNFMFSCPFHNDSNPSCGLSLKKGVFHCFACEEKGSFARLIAELDGITISEARKKLESDSQVEGIIQQIESELDQFYASEPKRKYISWKAFCNKYVSIAETPGETYLRSRRISSDTMMRFGIRWGGASGKWRNRVLVPIRDERGRILTFAGRAVKKTIKPKTKKYHLSKATALFGLYQLIMREKMTRFPYIILVEGEIDAMYLQQLGFYAVAVMGNHLGKAQTTKLLHFASAVIISYDNDTFGQKAAGEAFDKLRPFIRVFRAKLPDEKNDPNDLSPKEAMRIYSKYVSPLSSTAPYSGA